MESIAAHLPEALCQRIRATGKTPEEAAYATGNFLFLEARAAQAEAHKTS